MTEDLRIFPKVRTIPEKKPKSFMLFPFELKEKQRSSFEEKEAEALELIKNHLKTFKRCHVKSSHGKDSCIMVHLIWRACQELEIPMIEVWLNHTLNIFKEEPEFWDKYNKWLGIEDKFRVFFPPKDENGKQQTVWSIIDKVKHLPSFRQTSKKGSKDYKHTNIPECCDILKKATIKEYLKNLPEDERYDCVFVGTRAEESQMRSLGVLQRCRTYLQKTRAAYPVRVVTPLSFFTTNVPKNHQGSWNDSILKKMKNGKIKRIFRKGTKQFVYNKGESVPENDIEKYYKKWDMPMNPTYDIHNIARMGCASCPAHIGWEIRLCKDPTEDGFGMLKMNLTKLRENEPDRFNESIKVIRNYLKSRESLHEVNESMREKIISLFKKFNSHTDLSDFC